MALRPERCPERERFPKDDRGFTDHFQFSTGTEVYCHAQTFGIDPGLNLAGGFDGGVDDREWTPDERKELADYMIGLWTKYREKAHVPRPEFSS